MLEAGASGDEQATTQAKSPIPHAARRRPPMVALTESKPRARSARDIPRSWPPRPSTGLAATPTEAGGPYWTQSLVTSAASQLFTCIPKVFSVVIDESMNMGGAQELSVTQAVQLAPSPSRVVCSPVPKLDGSEALAPHSVTKTGTLAVAVATWLWNVELQLVL